MSNCIKESCKGNRGNGKIGFFGIAFSDAVSGLGFSICRYMRRRQPRMISKYNNTTTPEKLHKILEQDKTFFLYV